jgi:hypothetical protein
VFETLDKIELRFALEKVLPQNDKVGLLTVGKIRPLSSSYNILLPWCTLCHLVALAHLL